MLKEWMYRNARIQPANSPAVHIAKTTARGVAEQAKLRNENALEVMGTPCFIFKRLQTGRTCTCSMVVNMTEHPSGFDSEGNASQEHIQELLHGGRFGISEYSLIETRTNDKVPVLQPLETATPQIQDWQHTTMQHFDDHVAEDIIDSEVSYDPVFQSQIDMGLDSKRCAVCFGTQIVGGYSLFGGRRVVLTGHDAVGQFETNQATHPHKYTFGVAGMACDWKILLPKGIIACVEICVYNNDEVVSPDLYTLSIYKDPETVYTANSATIIQNADGFEWGLRLQSKVSDLEWTHIVIAYYTRPDMVKADFGILRSQFDPTLLESIGDLNIVLGPQAYDINSMDLIMDGMYGRLWRIVSTDPLIDGLHNVYGCSVSARLVQQYEPFFILNKRMTIPVAPYLPPQPTFGVDDGSMGWKHQSTI